LARWLAVQQSQKKNSDEALTNFHSSFFKEIYYIIIMNIEKQFQFLGSVLEHLLCNVFMMLYG
jgi:hypothetical protein